MANEFELDAILDGVIDDCMSTEFLHDTMVECRPRKRSYIARDREAAHQRLMRDYFETNPMYKEQHFRRRFRMPKNVFLGIVHALENHDEYFKQRFDAVGRISLSPYQKCIATVRQLCYGIAANGFDEYLKIGETTTFECLRNFCSGIIKIFGPTYQRKPTQTDIDYILAVNEARGFPGMLGSLDCIHWEWKKCPKSLRGSHSRRDHGNRPTVVLEAVATRDL